MDDDDGVAYTFAMIIMALLMLAFIWALCIPGINVVLSEANTRIEAGQISSQTADTINFNVTLYQYFPAFALGAMFLLAIIVALYHRKSDST